MFDGVEVVTFCLPISGADLGIFRGGGGGSGPEFFKGGGGG